MMSTIAKTRPINSANNETVYKTLSLKNRADDISYSPYLPPGPTGYRLYIFFKNPFFSNLTEQRYFLRHGHKWTAESDHIHPK